MQQCYWIDYSHREQWLTQLFESEKLASDDISRLKKLVPNDHLERLEPGDDFSLYLIENMEDNNQALFSFWTDIGLAGMNFGGSTIWGHFDTNNELLLTEEFAHALNSSGNSVKGTVAYNLHGIRGIFANGTFYTLTTSPFPSGERWAT